MAWTPPTGAVSSVDILREMLEPYGLGGMAADLWSWQQEALPPETIQARMWQHPVYKAQYPAMEQLRKQGMALTEAEYMDWDTSVANLIRDARMPPGVYDTRESRASLMLTGKSVSEIGRNIERGFTRVFDAPPEVRAAYKEFYGVDGDAALAALVLDPNNAASALERQAEVARIAGFGWGQGVGVTADTANAIFDRAITSEQARQGFTELAQTERLFAERASEGTDLLAEREGAAAQFGLDDGTAGASLRRRLQQRTADLGGSGAIAGTQEGLVGLGGA